MSFGKSKSKSSQTQSGTSTTTVDPWAKSQFENQTKGILDTAQGYTQSPFQAYTGQMVAGMTPDMAKAREVAGGSVGNWQGILDEAEGAAREGLATEWNPEGVNYRTMEDFGANKDAYLNPYMEGVLGTYDEQLAKQLNEQKAAATLNNAYGGARHGIREAEANRTAALDKANLSFQTYDKAMDRYGQDSDRLYTAGMNDAQRTDAAAKWKAENKYQGAGILGNLGSERQRMSTNDVQMLEQLGASEREIQQLTMDAERAEFDREAQDRINKLLLELQTRQGILSSTPMGQTTTSSGTGTSSGSSSQFGFAPKFSFGPLTFGA